jgi:polyhydroxybutyrate depolymerase
MMKYRFYPLFLAALALGLSTACVPPADGGETRLPRDLHMTRLSPGDHDRTLVVGGETRTYRLHVSTVAESENPRPLVIVLHGGGQSGRRIQELIYMDRTAERHGFWVAYPDGTKGLGGGFTWNGGDCCGAAMRKKIDDVDFIEELIRELTEPGWVDPRRVYATGISNGAIFSYRLGCELSDKIAAIAPIAGALMMDQCKPGRPVPAIIFHGSQDKHVKVEGGRNLMSGAKRAFPPLGTTRDRWLEINGCSEESERIYQKGDSTCWSYTDCGEQGDVTFCMIEGGGHTWPGGEPLRPDVLGYTTDDLSANEAMWEFFEDHPLPTSKEPHRKQPRSKEQADRDRKGE